MPKKEKKVKKEKVIEVELLFHSADKLERAKNVVASKGKVPSGEGQNKLAEVVVYEKLVEANPKYSEEQLVVELYKALGGVVVEHEV